MVSKKATSSRKRNGNEDKLTQHVALFVLTPMAIGDVRLNAKMKYGEVLDRVLLWIQPANNAKTLAIIDVSANFVQSQAEGGKGKVIAINQISIET